MIPEGAGVVVLHQLTDLCTIWKQNLKKVNRCLLTITKHGIGSRRNVILHQEFAAGLSHCTSKRGIFVSTPGKELKHRRSSSGTTDFGFSVFKLFSGSDITD